MEDRKSCFGKARKFFEYLISCASAMDRKNASPRILAAAENMPKNQKLGLQVLFEIRRCIETYLTHISRFSQHVIEQTEF